MQLFTILKNILNMKLFSKYFLSHRIINLNWGRCFSKWKKHASWIITFHDHDYIWRLLSSRMRCFKILNKYKKVRKESSNLLATLRFWLWSLSPCDWWIAILKSAVSTPSVWCRCDYLFIYPHLHIVYI